VAFGTFSLSNERRLASIKLVKIISDVLKLLLNVVAIQKVTHL
jgi:hypothetical protein